MTIELGFFHATHIAREDSEGETLYDRMLEMSITADRAGFTTIWFPEHHLVRTLASPSALLPAVQTAQHVSCRVGAAVIVLPFHEPIRLAGEIAVTDLTTGGRFELGVARGAYRYEFDIFGIKWDEAKQVNQEMLEAIEALLGNETTSTTYEGQFVSVRNAYIWPRPRTKPMPPVWIGAQTASSIEQAAADGYHVMHSAFVTDEDALREVAAAFDRGRATRQDGGKGQKLLISRYAAISESEAEIEEMIDNLLHQWRIHRQLHDYTQTADARGVIEAVVGENEPTRAELRRNLLFGTVAEVREKIDFYASIGVTQIAINAAFGVRQELVLQTIRLMAEAAGVRGRA